MKKKRHFLFAVFLLLLAATLSANAQTYNETIIALNQSREDVRDMVEAGFTVLRINDTLTQAEQLFTAQYALQQSGGSPDYSYVITRTEDVTELRRQAETVSDELQALEERLKDVPEGSEAFSIFAEAQREFNDERYELVPDIIEQAYVHISEEQALQTRFRAIYEASTKTLANFFRKNWKIIGTTLIIISIAYYFLHRRISIYIVERKMKNLHFEKEVLKKLIKKAQYEYFHLYKIPEELYHIRTEKFSELIRNIDRQIPVLLEDRERLKGRTKQVESKQTEPTEKKSRFHVGLSEAALRVFRPIRVATRNIRERWNYRKLLWQKRKQEGPRLGYRVKIRTMLLVRKIQFVILIFFHKMHLIKSPDTTELERLQHIDKELSGKEES